ncbi:MAG: hypothetical protein KY429_11925 [Actinobacteria bacterium]|nr:hypothetical protein [Actinomycetota bacterium]
MAVASPAWASHGGSHPDSINGPPADGCERFPEGYVTDSSPQWVYVNRDPQPVYVRGPIAEAHPTYTDNFSNHDSYDMNWNVKPLPEHQSVLSTANLREDAGDEFMAIHNEWEQIAHPLYSWPTIGDDVEMIGPLVWDCGHWGKDVDKMTPQELLLWLTPGTQPGEEITGERTEIHPPFSLVVHRAAPSTTPTGGAVTDVLISSNGTLVRAIADREIGKCKAPSTRLCSQWQPVNQRDYEFSILAPPKPPGASTIRHEILDRGSKNSPEPAITTTSDRIIVRVPFKGWGTEGQEMVFAKTFIVGWDRPRQTRHLRVTLDKLEWLVELDNPSTSPLPPGCLPMNPCSPNAQQTLPPNEVNFYVDIAGQWRQLDIPGLLAVRAGNTFDLKEVFDVYLSGSRWRVHARARECDQPHFRECPVPQEQGFNDDGGLFNHFYDTSSPAAGSYVGEGNSGVCTRARSGPCFRLAYRVDDLGNTLPGRSGGLAPTGPEPLPRFLFVVSVLLLVSLALWEGFWVIKDRRRRP